MKIDDVKSVSLLSCKDFCSMMEEDGITPEENDALAQHLARCPKCREEYDLIRLMRTCAVPPPADLTENVMRRIRTEKAKTARRRALSRIAGVACAAVILVPTLVVLLPHLRTTSDESLHAPADKTYCAGDASFTCGADTNAQDMIAPGTLSEAADDLLDYSADADDKTGSMPPKVPAEYYEDDTPAPLSPLSTSSTTEGIFNGSGDLPEDDTIPGTENESPLDPSDTEPAFYDEIRAIVGEEAFDAWLAQYDGAPDEAENAAYAYFGIEK